MHDGIQSAVRRLHDSMRSVRNLIGTSKLGDAKEKLGEAIRGVQRLVSHRDSGNQPASVVESLQLAGELQMSLQELNDSQETLELAVQTAGEDKELIAVKAKALIQLAHVARQLEGESSSRAGTAIEEARSLLEHNTGLEELDVLLHSVKGMRELDKGNTTGALESLQHSVILGQKLFGPHHPRVAGLLSNIGEVYRSTGDYLTAGEVFRRSAKILKGWHGKESPLAAAPLSGWAQTLLELGEVKKALKHLHRQRDVYEKAYGKGYGRLAKTYSLLGKAYGLYGDFEEANRQHNEAMRIAEETYGKGHWRYGRSLRYRGDTLLREGVHNDALKAYETGLDIYNAQARQEDDELACFHAGIGRAHLEAGNPNDALRHLQKSIGIWEKSGRSPRDLEFARSALDTARDQASQDR